MSAIKQPHVHQKVAAFPSPRPTAPAPSGAGTRLLSHGLRWAQPRTQPPRRRSARGQSTVEYALLVVGIATVALLVLAWASSTDVVGALFDRVFRWVTGRVG